MSVSDVVAQKIVIDVLALDTYLIEGEDGLMAVDVGSHGCAMDIANYLTTALNRPISDIRYITATHFHIDHIGGIGHLLDMCPSSTRVVFYSAVDDYISGRRKIPLIKNWFVGFPSATLVSTRYLRKTSHLCIGTLAGIPLPGLRNITRLPFEKNRIDYFGHKSGSKTCCLNNFGFGEWEVIKTPGHTEDSICFFNDSTGELLTGDLIVNTSSDGRGDLNRFCWDRNRIRESYEYLCKRINPVLMYPGHGEMITGGADTLLKVRVF